MSNIPNFDTMNPDELWNFYQKYSTKTSELAAELVGDRRKGYIEVARRLAAYACNKAVEIKCAAEGDSVGADIYSMICDDIYLRLPEDLRW